MAATRSQELFLLAVVGLALGTALGASALGLSLAFGAFLAGTYDAQIQAWGAYLKTVNRSVFLRPLYEMGPGDYGDAYSGTRVLPFPVFCQEERLP